MANELSLFSIEILGLVGRQGAGPHDLRRLAQRGRMLAWAGESQYYTEPKRLAKLGYLAARKEPGKTRERTVYTLTDKGLDALREYAARPVTFTPLKSDALLRMLICDLAGEPVTRESMRRAARRPRRHRRAARPGRGGGTRPPPPREVPADRHPLPAPLPRAPRGARGRGRARAQRLEQSSRGDSARAIGDDPRLLGGRRRVIAYVYTFVLRCCHGSQAP